MLSIFPGMTRNSGAVDKFTFNKYDKNGDGVISQSEYDNFVQAVSLNNPQVIQNKKNENKGFNLEQFDPQGPINFESNGGYNSKRLNIIA